jgi:predicted nucleic acid-binding protein
MRTILILLLLFISVLTKAQLNTHTEDAIKNIILLTKEGNFEKVEESIVYSETIDKYVLHKDLKILNRVLQNYEIPNFKEWIYEDLRNIEWLQLQTINLIFF